MTRAVLCTVMLTVLASGASAQPYIHKQLVRCTERPQRYGVRLRGADLAGVVNEAALLAVRGGATAVGHDELRRACERVRHGTGSRARVLGEVRTSPTEVAT